MQLSIVIPCYNEAENVDKLRDELLPVLTEILEGEAKQTLASVAIEISAIELIFVDDGSRDQTFEKLSQTFGASQNPSIRTCIERHPTNLGLGAAIRTGLRAASGEIIVTMDSDGTYQFSTLPALLACLEPDIDLVTASPYHPKGGVLGVPAYRLVLSRGSSILYQLLVSRQIHTYTCLYRAYRQSVVRNISFSSNGFLANTEILVQAIFKGYQVREYPATLSRRMYGVSKAKIMRTIASHLAYQWKILRIKTGRSRSSGVSKAQAKA